MENDFFTVTRGQNIVLDFTPSTDQGVTNITGWTLAFNISRQPGQTVILGPLTPTVTSAANGEYEVELTAAQTATLSVGRYYWDVWRTDSGDEDPIATGMLEVVSGVRLPS